jgi:hypothetical protein
MPALDDFVVGAFVLSVSLVSELDRVSGISGNCDERIGELVFGIRSVQESPQSFVEFVEELGRRARRMESQESGGNDGAL